MDTLNILWTIVQALTLVIIKASSNSNLLVEEYGRVVLKQTINLTTSPEYSLVFKKDGEFLIEYLIPNLECVNVNEYNWLHPVLDRVNNSLVLTLTLTNVTSIAQGLWILESHMNHGREKRQYFTQSLQVYEKPKGLKCYSGWSGQCLTLNCSFQTVKSPEKVFQVTVTLETGVNYTGVCSLSPSRDQDLYTTVCLAQIPSVDLPVGNHTLEVSVLPSENPETQIVHNTNIQIPLVIENPAVKVTDCSEISTPGESAINCTCERLDASNITTEIMWHINNVTANNQSALIMQNQDCRSSTISITTKGESTEISCLATNSFSWQSEAVMATPKLKVTAQRTEDSDTNIAIIVPIVIAVVMIISILVCWRTGLFKKLPCRSKRRVERPVCHERIELQSDEMNKLYVLTLGMPASGKSATCNLILGRSQFLSSNSTRNVTTKFESAAARFNDKEIILVDSPGVAFNNGNHSKNLSWFVYRALQENPNGYDVLIYVFRYKARFTDEDGTMLAFQQAMEANFLRKYGMFVVTNAEQFEPDEHYSSIQEWCEAQTGVFKKIVEACQNRVVFVNNREKDLDERERMRNTIIEMITEISQPTARFNRDAIQYTISMHVIDLFRRIYNCCSS